MRHAVHSRTFYIYNGTADWQSFQEIVRTKANIVTRNESTSSVVRQCELTGMPDRPEQAMILEPAILESFGPGTMIREVTPWYEDIGIGIIFLLEVEITPPCLPPA